jgi:hypothetical protein
MPKKVVTESAVCLKQMTQDTCILALDRIIDDILANCIERYIFVDTIDLLFEDWIEPFARLELTHIVGSRLIITKSRAKGAMRLRLHRPTVETINFIIQKCPPHIVSRVDYAYDFIVASTSVAREMQELFKKHLIMLWHGEKKLSEFSATTYYAETWKRRNIVLYSDKPSKITGEAALHLEFRWFGAESCRNIGVRYINRILEYAPIQTICRQSKFGCLNWRTFEKKLGRLAESRLRNHRSRGPWMPDIRGANLRVRGFLCRLLQIEDKVLSFTELKDETPIQVWIDFARSKSIFSGCVTSSLVRHNISRLIVGATHIKPSFALGDTNQIQRTDVKIK